jgi:hypothetical protein
MGIAHAGPLLLIALLAGCARQARSSHFEPAGVIEPKLQRDQNECVAQSIDGTSQDRGGVLRINRDAYQRCMEQHGYTLG